MERAGASRPFSFVIFPSEHQRKPRAGGGREAESAETISRRAHRGAEFLSGGGSPACGSLRPAHGSREGTRTNGAPSHRPFVRAPSLDPCRAKRGTHRLAVAACLSCRALVSALCGLCVK